METPSENVAHWSYKSPPASAPGVEAGEAGQEVGGLFAEIAEFLDLFPDTNTLEWDSDNQEIPPPGSRWATFDREPRPDTAQNGTGTEEVGK
jgi:hypothetical protein